MGTWSKARPPAPVRARPGPQPGARLSEPPSPCPHRMPENSLLAPLSATCKSSVSPMEVAALGGSPLPQCYSHCRGCVAPPPGQAVHASGETSNHTCTLSGGFPSLPPTPASC